MALTGAIKSVILSQTLENRVKKIIRSNNGSLFLPSPGTCFQDSVGTIPCAVDTPVGRLVDSVGNSHATQVTAGYKPILRGKYKNQLRYSDELSNTSAWARDAGASVTAANVITSISPFAGVKQSVSYFGSEATGQVVLSGTGTCQIFLQENGGAYSTYGSVTDIALTATPTLHSISVTKPDTNGTRLGIRIGSDVGSSITAHYCQLESGLVATPYIHATIAPASSVYGPYWLNPDGVDDVLTIGAIAGASAATLVHAIKNSGTVVETGIDLTLGYSWNKQLTNGFAIFPSAPSAADLSLVQRYMEGLTV